MGMVMGSERHQFELVPAPVQQCSIRIDKEDIKFSA